jgi:hypothetical protein
MVHVTSNISIEQPQFGLGSFVSSGQASGEQASATAVLTTNQIGAWRLGCEMTGSVVTPISCRVSWLCI